MRAAVLQLFHEANAFKPEQVGLRDFEQRYILTGDAVRVQLGQTRNWIGGVLEGLDQAGVETRIGLCAAAHPGGRVDRESFQILHQRLLASLEDICARGTPDLICLLLHGALAVEGVGDPESEIVRSVRRLTGPAPVIAVSLDFHGNPGSGLMREADVVVPGIRYPHDDTRERGRKMVALALRCRSDGLHSWRFRLPLAVPMPRQATFEGPYAQLVQHCGEAAKTPGIADVCLMGGFPYSDDDRACTSLIVTARTREQAAPLFKEISGRIWDCHHALTEPIQHIDSGQAVRDLLHAPGTLVIADVGDNPGAGGLGDDATLLQSLVQSGERFAAGILVSPEIARLAVLAGTGARLTCRFGSSSPCQSGQQPWQAEVRVLRCGPFSYRNQGPMMAGELLDGGPGAVLQIGNGVVLVSTARIQAYDVQAFLSQGIDLGTQRIVAIKTSAHFRSSYGAYATAGIALVDNRGWSTTDMRAFDHRRRRRPIMPLTSLTHQDWMAAIREEAAAADDNPSGTPQQDIINGTLPSDS